MQTPHRRTQPSLMQHESSIPGTRRWRPVVFAGLFVLPLLALSPRCFAQPEEAACEPWVEMQGDSARLRPHIDAFAACHLDEKTYTRLVRSAVCPDDSKAALPASIALGRVEELPWLARALAEAAMADPGWNARRGKPRDEHINALVARLLMSAPIRERLEAPLADRALTITGVSVEKVLVRRLRDVVPEAEGSSRRVPVDAQVWLRIGPASR